MKFTLSWLKDHLDINPKNDNLVSISECLTSLGLEVENVSDPKKNLIGFKVGCIKNYYKHPNADKLSICEVDIGSNIVEIVCGADNLSKEMKVVFAPSGSIMPETNIKLKKTKIRGVVSNGMLCSERELCISDEHNGIIELEKDSEIGSEASLYLNNLDPVIEIAITPNRQDCLGVRGIARDLAAKKIGELKNLSIKEIQGDFDSPINVEIDSDSNKSCSLFLGRYFKGVKNVESPDWLQERLNSIGLKPISALVDITNYITFDLCRPLHVFDADNLNGDLSIRQSKKDEEVITLDDKKYQLDNACTVIVDDSGIISLAGIMGGMKTGSTIETKNVFLESALFDPIAVAKTGRHYGIDSDARYRFERGVDPNSAEDGMHLATQMILDICGGEPSRIVKAGEKKLNIKEIAIDSDRVRKHTGIDINNEEIENILNELGFKVLKYNGALLATVPSWRSDIYGEADIIEEVIRVFGYDKIPTSLFRVKGKQLKSKVDQFIEKKNRSRKVLVSRGFNECISWSFMSEEVASYFNSNPIKLMNPISRDLNVMRPSIIPNLVQASKRNFDRGFSEISLFEIGPIFDKDLNDKQNNIITLIRSGFRFRKNWRNNEGSFSVFDLKEDIFSLLHTFGIITEKLQIDQKSQKWFHPGKSAFVKEGNGNILASFGELHPELMNNMDITFPLVAGEIYINNLPIIDSLGSKEPFVASDFPSVTRDFSFVVNKSVSAQEIIFPLRESNIKTLKEINVFDIFEDKTFDEGKKFIAISVILESKDKTFTEVEIETICRKIIKIVKNSSGATLRI